MKLNPVVILFSIIFLIIALMIISMANISITQKTLVVKIGLYSEYSTSPELFWYKNNNQEGKSKYLNTVPPIYDSKKVAFISIGYKYPKYSAKVLFRNKLGTVLDTKESIFNLSDTNDNITNEIY